MAALFSGGKKRSETLYNEMREAINSNDHQQMREIIADKDYKINKVGGGDLRTALHTATMREDREALEILLDHQNIDTNKKTSDGLTPFLLAATLGKMVSFEVLLTDNRVNHKIMDSRDKSALELVEALGKKIKTHEAKELLERRKSRRTHNHKDGKLAILIGNSKYAQETGLDNLTGAKRDLEAMRSKLRADGYKIEVIENSADMLEDVEKVMTNTSENSVNFLQVLYAGGWTYFRNDTHC